MRPRTLCFAVLPLALCACIVQFGGSSGTRVHTIFGSGYEARSARKVPAFTRVLMQGSVDVQVDVGPAQAVVVIADDDLLNRVRTEVRGDTLFVDVDEGSYRFHVGPRVEISVPDLEVVRVEGSGSAVVSGLDRAQFEVDLTGSGELIARGKAALLEVSVGGSGTARLEDLEARTVHAHLAGSGDARVWAHERIETELSGSGSVLYRGEAVMVTSDAHGSGRVVHDG